MKLFTPHIISGALARQKKIINVNDLISDDDDDGRVNVDLAFGMMTNS